jgi:hypothetical protein
MFIAIIEILTSLKTVHGSVGACTALIRDVQFKWQ